MKKAIALLSAAIMAAGVLTACGGSDSEKTFTVGFDAEFPLTVIWMRMVNT